MYGVAVGQLSMSPLLVSMKSSLDRNKAPVDDRDQEILYSGLVAGGFSVIGILQVRTLDFIRYFDHLDGQVVSIVDDELKPWVAAASFVAGLASALDLFFRKGNGIKLAFAGFDRLLSRDPERQAHSDGAALLLGYLLGLPCFCFQPDITEALKMLKEGSDSLLSYQKYQKGVPSTSTKSPTSVFDSLQKLSLFKVPSGREESPAKENKSLAISRVLVWLMAPVAAEYLKYGSP